jgi:hypothetical protein
MICRRLARAALGSSSSNSRTLGAIVTLTEVAGTAVIVLVLLTVILFGSDDICERAFRLLRWAANRPEPPGFPPKSRRRKL